MRCIHHNDADGYGAAAIVRYELQNVWEPVLPTHFVEYSHNGFLKIDDPDEFYKEGQTLYIVDLALDATIFEAIKNAINHGLNVVHIDHHISGKHFADALSEEDRLVYDKVTKLFSLDWSGCMLTWIFSCMNETERANPDQVQFDIAEDLSQLAIGAENDASFRVVQIPLVIRLIDDNDIWRHSLPESKLFASAWSVQNNHPLNQEFWQELLYEGPKKTYDIITQGEIIFNYLEKQSERIMRNAFEFTLGDYTGIVVNAASGNSRLFGEDFDKYDFVCRYHQIAPNRWQYHFYSSKNASNQANCEELVKTYFNELNLCGGHFAAAGATISHNAFDNAIAII